MTFLELLMMRQQLVARSQLLPLNSHEEAQLAGLTRLWERAEETSADDRRVYPRHTCSGSTEILTRHGFGTAEFRDVCADGLRMRGCAVRGDRITVYFSSGDKEYDFDALVLWSDGLDFGVRLDGAPRVHDRQRRAKGEVTGVVRREVPVEATRRAS